MFETVVVGADGSESALEAVKAAIDLVKQSGGKLHIVSSYKPKHFSGMAEQEVPRSLDAGDVTEAVLADLASRARTAGVVAESHHGTEDPAELICGVAERVGADLIVVGNKGMTGVRRVLGSVPNSVAHEATCSVLIVATTSH
ncbi:MAG TPA: universal stress protein [Acidimicrobiales bacterium]|nr:universal stress protein [Acidimicrobiales bacterium]